MTYVLFLINILLIFFICGFIWSKINIIKLTAISIVTFFSEYIIISGLLFWVDRYSINGLLALVAAMNLFIFIMCYKRRKSMFKLDFKIRVYMIPIVVTLLALPFVFQKFEFFGMGQDEGVYQTHAIQLIYGKTDIQQDFEEYYTLNTGEEKEYYKDSMEKQLIGLYNYDPSLPFASEDKEISSVSATFHGIPTFASVLALWGKMFGIAHMADIQTLFFICSIFFMYFILDELKIKKSVKIVTLSLFAFSPLVIWVSKSALTEIILTCLVAAFIYFIIRGDKKSIYWSIVPIAAFSFFHITVYTMIPIFLLIYWLGYIYTKRKEFIIGSIITTTAFLAGITMIEMIAGTYAFIHNFKPVYHILPFANANNVVYIIWGCCLLCYIISLTLWKVNKVCLLLKRLLNSIKLWGFRLSLVLILLFQIKLMFDNREFFHGLHSSFNHLTLIGFGLITGIVVPAIAGILSFIKTKQFTNNLKNAMIGVVFIYCIGIYSNAMWKYIEYYYYYGRYLAPYVIIVLLFSALMLQNLKNSHVYVAGGLSLCILLPFSSFLINHKDDTRITWNVIEDITSMVNAEDTVVINPDDMKFYYLPIRAITGAKVYPAETNYIDQMNKLQNQENNNIYYMRNGENFNASLETVYRNEFITSEDNNVYDGKWIPFPNEFSYSQQSVNLERLEIPKYEYNFIEDYNDLVFDGLGALEDGFCWTNSPEFKLKCYLNKNNYDLVIQQGALIPLDSLELSSFELSIFINGSLVKTTEIAKDNNGKNITVHIPESLVIQGENILEISSELWSPSEYGSDDQRKLGYALEKIYFTIVDN